MSGDSTNQQFQIMLITEAPDELPIRETKSEEGPHLDFINQGWCPGGASQLLTPLGTLKNIFKTKRTTNYFLNRQFNYLALNKSDLDYIHLDIRLYAFITLSRTESSIEGATFH